MAAFRTGRKGRYILGVGEPSKASPAVWAVEAVLDRRNPVTTPRTPKGMVQQCWAGQEKEFGDLSRNARGGATLSADTQNRIREMKEGRK